MGGTFEICRTGLVASFEVETAGVTNRLTVWRAPPERGACSAAVAVEREEKKRNSSQ